MKKTILTLFLCLCALNCSFAQDVDSLAIQHPEYLPTLELGTIAPEIVAKDTSGTVIKLSDFRGKYVIIDFWATWCGDCRREVPGLKELYAKEEYKTINGNETQWLSFSFDDKEESWRNFLRREQFPWPQVSNLIRTREDPTYKAYGLHWIPAFLIIDPEGKIVGRAITAKGLEAELKNCCKEKAESQYDIYLFIGQSNCAGRGPMLQQDSTEIQEGVWLLNDSGIPEPAKAPFNRYSNIRKSLSMQQIGPAFSFGQIMYEKRGHKVLIIQNAKGGSGLAEWENEDPEAITYLDTTLMRAIPALQYGVLKGIVWHQGETDTSNGSAGEIYITRFNRMISRLREAMKVGEEVPVLVGELGQWEWEKTELIEAFNEETLPKITETVPNCHKIESDGLECRSEDHTDPHFSRTANIELGKRYAEKMLEILGNSEIEIITKEK